MSLDQSTPADVSEKYVINIGGDLYQTFADVLKNEAQDEIGDLHETAHDNQAEVGQFVWREPNGTLSFSEQIVGSEGRISATQIFPRLEQVTPEARHVSFIHTHPPGEIFQPSAPDLLALLARRVDGYRRKEWQYRGEYVTTLSREVDILPEPLREAGDEEQIVVLLTGAVIDPPAPEKKLQRILNRFGGVTNPDRETAERMARLALRYAELTDLRIVGDADALGLDPDYINDTYTMQSSPDGDGV